MSINTSTNPNGRIDASNAGQFSSAAYNPKGSSITDQLGPNWREDQGLTVVSQDETNQMRAFVNDATKQIVFAFKGSDNYSNFKSDLTDAGASEYAKIQAQATQSLKDAAKDYPGYQVVSTGHSLGGGMAQSFALQYDLNGFAQNALPIASGTFDDIFPGQDPTTLVENYRKNNQFIATNVSGDIATFTYSTVGRQVYLDSNPTTLPSVWGFVSVAGLQICGFTVGIGCAAAFGAAAQAHLLPTFHALAGQYAVGSDGRLIVPADGIPNVTTTKTTNADGSYQVTGTDGEGNTFTGTFAQNGALTSDSWITKDGTTGSDSYFNQDGKAQILQYELRTQNPDNSQIVDRKHLNSDGTILNAQVTTTQANGQVSAALSGNDGIATLNNAIVTLAAGANATVNGSGNHYLGGAGATLTTSQSDGTQLTIINSADGSTMTVNVVNDAGGVKQQVLMGNNFNVQVGMWTRADGATMLDFTATDGKGLNNGQDSLVEVGYDPQTGQKIVEVHRQTNGLNTVMNLNADNTTTVVVYGNHADGSFNWTPSTAAQTFQGSSTNIQVGMWTRADGATMLDFTATDGKGLNNGQDSLVEVGYDSQTGQKIVEVHRQTNGLNMVMNLNADNTTTVVVYGNHADGSFNWTPSTAAQTFQGSSTNVQVGRWTRADGAQMLDFTATDGKGLNNGQDSLIEVGYDPQTGRKIVELRRQTNGTNVLTNLNADNSTSIVQYGNHADGSVNWTPLTTTETSIDAQGRLHSKLTHQDGKFFETIHAAADRQSKVVTQTWLDSKNQLHVRESYKESGFWEKFHDSKLGQVELIQAVAGDIVLAALRGGLARLPAAAAGVDFNFGSIKHTDFVGQPWAFTHPPTYPGIWTVQPVLVIKEPGSRIEVYPATFDGLAPRSAFGARHLESNRNEAAMVSPAAAPATSLNHLVQSMAAFTDGNTGIDPSFSPANANAEIHPLAASRTAPLA